MTTRWVADNGVETQVTPANWSLCMLGPRVMSSIWNRSRLFQGREQTMSFPSLAKKMHDCPSSEGPQSELMGVS